MGPKIGSISADFSDIRRQKLNKKFAAIYSAPDPSFISGVVDVFGCLAEEGRLRRSIIHANDSRSPRIPSRLQMSH